MKANPIVRPARLTAGRPIPRRQGAGGAGALHQPENVHVL